MGSRRRSRRREKAESVGTPAGSSRRAWPGWFPGRTELLILFTVAVVRGVHWAGMQGDPLAGIPRMDPQYHDLWAQRIAAGHLTFDGPFFRAPLYAYFLGLLYAVSGKSIPFAEGVQLALGLVSVFLIFRIGRRTVGKTAGIVAGAAYGIYPVALRYEGDLLVEGLYIVFILAALLAQLRTLERPTGRRWFGTGLLYGLAAITRPNILLPALAVPGVTFLGRKLARSHASIRRAGLEGAVLALGIVVPIVPVAVHNMVVGHDFVPIASFGGVNFEIGNNPHSDGFTALVPGTRLTWEGGAIDAVNLAEKGRGRKLKPSEVSGYWMEQGLRFLLDDPGAAFRLTVRKLYLFWWGGEISNNENTYFLRRYSWPLRATLWHAGVYFPFGIVGPLALIGMVLAWNRRRILTLPLLAFAVLFMVSVVMFFICDRFRLPILPALLLFAAYAVMETPRLLERRGRFAGYLGATLGLLLLLNADPYRLDRAIFGSQALSYIDLGLFHVSREDLDGAQADFRRAAALDPGNPSSYAWLGRIALRRGDLDGAKRELDLAVRGDPVVFRDVVVQARCDQGRLELKEGKADRARDRFQAALALDEGSAEATAGMGFASLALGDTVSARSYLERSAKLDPENRAVRGALSALSAGRR